MSTDSQTTASEVKPEEKPKQALSKSDRLIDWADKHGYAGKGSSTRDIYNSMKEKHIGQVNDKRFLHQLSFACGPGFEVKCDDFVIKPMRKGEIQVRNMTGEQEDGYVASPVDGLLDLIIQQPGKGIFGSRKVHTSAFPVDEIIITSPDSVTLIADGETLTATELRISVIPKHLQVITGKNRQFADFQHGR